MYEEERHTGRAQRYMKCIALVPVVAIYLLIFSGRRIGLGGKRS